MEVRYNIGGTSAVCGTTNHSWRPGIADNYRVCRQCQTVEVLRNGQWELPTSRGAKRSSATSAPTPALDFGVHNQDLQASVPPACPTPQVEASEQLERPMKRSEIVKQRAREDLDEAMRKQRLAEVVNTDKNVAKLRQWSKERRFPRLTFPVYLDADFKRQELITVEQGEEHWSSFLAGDDAGQFILDDRFMRAWLAAGAYDIETRHVTQPVEQIVEIAKSRPPFSLAEVRKMLLDLGEEFGYPTVQWRDWYEIDYELPSGEDAYLDRVGKAEPLWLWMAVQAVQQVYGQVQRGSSHE